jgi:hypothetical protein
MPGAPGSARELTVMVAAWATPPSAKRASTVSAHRGLGIRAVARQRGPLILTMRSGPVLIFSFGPTSTCF